jgi:hypothetical protein
MSTLPPGKTRGPGNAGTHKLMMEKLATSCLGEREARALGIRVASEAELRSLDLFPVPAMELPYFDLSGNRTAFKRWRYLADTRTGFAALTDAKAVRYVQAKDSLQEAYMPPLTDWSELARDAGAPLAITEGELKAACATLLAMPTIGLGGVWSFKSRKKKKPLLDAFYEFDWKGRYVTIIYDSDASTNPKVVQARSALARELLALGAAVYVADIPPTEDGSKQGLDDYALANGAEALASLMGSGTAFAESAVMHELNEEVVYVRDPGVVVRYVDNQVLRPSDFTGHAYANRHIVEFYEDKDGNPKERLKPASRAWLEWPARGELRKFTFMPGQRQVTEKSEFNRWPGWGCEPRKGDVSPWRQLLDHLFAGAPEERQWLERWLAYPLQHPGSKMYTSAVVWGVKTGTGKSLIGYTMKRIYGRTFTEIGDRELQDDRKEWAVDKCFVLGDDVTGHEQRNLSDRLKKMITQESMRVDIKFLPSYEVPDFINYYFTSNHPDAFFLEDDDRRMFVHEVKCAPLPPEFYDRYRVWLEGGGAEALFHHLMTLDLGDMRAQGRAPATEAKRRMAEDGMSELGRWVRRLKDEPEMVLKFGDAKLTGDLWTSAELFRIFDPEEKKRATPGALTKELKRAGVEQVYGGMQLRTRSGLVRLFAVRNPEQWAKAKGPDIIKHYDATRGPVERKAKY